MNTGSEEKLEEFQMRDLTSRNTEMADTLSPCQPGQVSVKDGSQDEEKTYLDVPAKKSYTRQGRMEAGRRQRDEAIHTDRTLDHMTLWDLCDTNDNRLTPWKHALLTPRLERGVDHSSNLQTPILSKQFALRLSPNNFDSGAAAAISNMNTVQNY